MNKRKLKFIQKGPNCQITFFAMGSPCEILLNNCKPTEETRVIGQSIANEAWRIEDKYSRYITGNIIDLINNSNGKPICVDEETAKLLNFAEQCYQLSEGLFDITTGILRKAWQFGQENKRIATQAELDKLLPLTGWHQAKWQEDSLQLKKDMQIDFGGIGKEYAVDRCAQQLSQLYEKAYLINFGGDLVASPLPNNEAWLVGIEHPDNTENSIQNIELYQGALATSGDVKRFIEIDGMRYGHILNPLTGWPVENAARSITVHAHQCTDAGILSTLAMLQGSNAESFLEAQDVKYWCYR